MSYSGDDTHSANARRGSSASCKPLLDVATPELFRTNAFRITGLRVDATTREIAKHADKLKMMEELGQGKSVHTGAFALKTPPSVDQIREAIQRLKEPEQRIIDEFFWFWPRQFGQSASDPALKALETGDADGALKVWESLETHPSEGVVAIHNIAVLWHCMALEWERHYAKAVEFTKEQRAEVDKLWRGSFKRWEVLAVDDLFWAKVSARIKDLDDPRLTTGFARKMRATLPHSLYKINAELAARYADRGNMVSARAHATFLRESGVGHDKIAGTVELALAPAAAWLKQQIGIGKERVARNVSETVSVVRELLKNAQKTLEVFELLLGRYSDPKNELSDEIAVVCSQLPIAYHKATGDNQGSIELLKLVLPFAKSSDTRETIEKNLKILTSNLAFKRMEPVHKLLKAIQDSVSLPSGKLERFKSMAQPAIASASTEFSDSEAYADLCDGAAIVLREIGLAAWNEHKDLPTALLANAMACKYGKDAQLRTRLSADAKILRDMELQLAEAKAAREKEEKATQMRWGIGIGIFAIIALINNCEGSRKTSQKEPSSSGYYSQEPTPIPTPNVPPKANAPYGGTRKQTAEEFLDEKPLVSPTPTIKPTFASNNQYPAAPQPVALPIPSTAAQPTPSTIKDAPALLWAVEAPEWRITFATESELDVQKRAIAMFPSLGVADSPLNKEFVARYNNYKTWRKPYFDNPGWPMMLAWECNREIDRKSNYLVPGTHNDELTKERTRIGSERKILEEYTIRLKLRAREIDIDRALLNRRNKTAVDTFNGVIESYDALVSLAKEQERVVNQLVNDFNEKLRRYGR